MDNIISLEDKFKNIKECKAGYNFLVDMVINGIGDLQFETDEEEFKRIYNDIIDDVIHYVANTHYQK